MSGSLYLCATPIGNLEDITLRALSVLKRVTLIMAEDTRVTKKLLDKYNIETPMMSYHKFNEIERIDDIIKRLKIGEEIALVTDAGTPAISDPGALIVQKCMKEQIKIIPIPGASALGCALSVSGILSPHFIFYGFLDKSITHKENQIQQLKNTGYSYILFESPKRLLETLQSLATVYQQNQPIITIARELTKIYEEITTDTLDKVIEHYKSKNILGEIVIIVHGQDHEEVFNIQTIENKIKELMDQGYSTGQIVKKLTGVMGLSKNQLYDLVLKML